MDSDGVPALLVVDMQYDFVHGSLAVPDATSIINPINDLLVLPFVTKVATKDWHPEGHVSFAQTHDKPLFSAITIFPPGDTVQDRPFEQVLWPVHCVASTPGAAFVEGLNYKVFDHIVHKGDHLHVDSYSGFRDCWQLNSTPLPTILKDARVTDVFIVGLAGDYCVKWTALDAVEFGYKTWIVRDGVRSVFDTGAEWDEMEKKGIRIIDSEEVKRYVK